MAIQPTGEEVEIAAVVTPPPAEELKPDTAPTQVAAVTLPQTASPLPLIALLGLLALGGAWALGLVQKRVSVTGLVHDTARLLSGAPAAGGGVAAEPGGEHMKALFWIGVVVLILGIVSLVMPIPRNEREGFMAGGMSFGVETQHQEKVSPFVSAVMILGGVGMMVAGKMRS